MKLDDTHICQTLANSVQTARGEIAAVFVAVTAGRGSMARVGIMSVNAYHFESRIASSAMAGNCDWLDFGRYNGWHGSSNVTSPNARIS